MALALVETSVPERRICATGESTQGGMAGQVRWSISYSPANTAATFPLYSSPHMLCSPWNTEHFRSRPSASIPYEVSESTIYVSDCGESSRDENHGTGPTPPNNESGDKRLGKQQVAKRQKSHTFSHMARLRLRMIPPMHVPLLSRFQTGMASM